jgi:anti-sigma regulatory factor (Ser/Thr protein kinase)
MSPQRRFPNEPASVSEARRYTLRTLDTLAPQLSDAVAVMVSELAANAVRHTASHFTVTIDQSDDLIRVAVSDGGAGSPIVRTPEPIEPSGRGLQIVQALAADWGVVPAANPPGKTVWFTVPTEPTLEAQTRAGREHSDPAVRRNLLAGEGRRSSSTSGGRGQPANLTRPAWTARRATRRAPSRAVGRRSR